MCVAVCAALQIGCDRCRRRALNVAGSEVVQHFFPGTFCFYYTLCLKGAERVYGVLPEAGNGSLS